jgi:fibronectin-binding autotransporter adhesin
MTNTINGTITAGIVITTSGAYTSPLTIGNSGAVLVSGTTAAISATISTPTLVNQGTIASTAGVGVDLTAGGDVGNSGLITGAYAVTVNGAFGFVDNSRTIVATGTHGDAILLSGGGSVQNHAVLGVYTGVIQAQGASGNGLVVTGGIGTVTNYGEIIASGSLGDGIDLQAGGTIISESFPATILGGNFGVLISGGVGYVRSQGYITGSAVAGIRLQSGHVINQAGGGLISGADGVEMIGGIGTVANYGTIRASNTGILLGAGGTVVDFGAITAATAIDFGAGNSLLELVFGYTISGSITASGTGNQLQLVGYAPVTLYSQFAGFQTLVAPSLSEWALTGHHDVSGVTIEGKLSNDGTLSASPGLFLGSAVDLINNGTIGSAVTVTGGVATLQNSGSVSGAVSVASAGIADNAGVLGNGVTLNGGQLTNEAGGTITSSGVAVMATGGATIVEAGAISGTTAIYLGTGGNLLRLEASRTLSGGVTANGAGNMLALGSAAGAGTLTGFGSAIEGFSTIGVDPGADWTVGGSFTTGISIGANGTLDLAAGSTLTATGSGVFGSPGSVINNGTITSNGSGVNINGGNVNNAATSAIISGRIRAVAFLSGNDTVTNAGTLMATGTSGRGVSLGNGLVNNSASALIYGDLFGVYSLGGIATVTNAGTIAAPGTSDYSVGVMLRSGGTVRDTGTIITGGSYAIYIAGTGGNRLELGTGYYVHGGIYVHGTGNSFALLSGTASGSVVPLASFSAITVDSGATLTPVGTQSTFASGDTLWVSGTIGGVSAITLEGGNLLAVGAGYSLPTIVAEGTGNRLEFLSGGSGTLTNINNRFTNFSSIALDPGTSWTIADAETIGAGTVVSGTFTTASTINNQGTLGGVYLHGGVVNNYGSIYLLLAAGGSVNNIGAGALINKVEMNGTLNNFGTVLSVDQLGPTALTDNARLVQGGSYGVFLGGGTLINSGTIEATSANGSGVVLYGAGTLIDSGTISGIGHGIAIGALSDHLLVLEHGYELVGGISLSSSAVGHNTIEMSNALGAVGFHYHYDYSTFKLDNKTTIAFGNTISAPITLYDDKVGPSFFMTQGFNAIGDAIDFTSLSDSSGTASYQVNGNHVTVTGDGSFAVVTLTSPPVPLVVQKDGSGHAELLVAPCFAEGTRIKTPRGHVAVEELREGDAVVTVSGRVEAIRWIGHRRVDCRRHPEPERVWPVRIAAHAFGQGRPRRALRLSPDHSVFVEDVLIPVKFLINDVTITQVRVDRIRYFHVELAGHDVVVAEGLPAESYLETGGRASFENAEGVTRLHADFAPDDAVVGEIWRAKGYAPLLGRDGELERARRMLALQAIMLARPRRRRRASAA